MGTAHAETEDGRHTERFWAHVTAFGALWGAIEVTLGSFLHTLRLPFAGMLLATGGAALLVVARQILPVRGAALAAGAVAALCKSLSPGGVVLGPMVAILTEAALVELALLAAPRAAPACALAGALAALWAVLQKLVTQLVLYGASILELYLSALRHARDGLGLPDAAGWWALALFLGVVVGIGAGGGLLGRAIGRDAALLLAARVSKEAA